MIRGSRLTVFAALAAAMLLPAFALAQTVSSTVETSVAGVVVNDPQGPATSGEVISFVEPIDAFTFDFSADGYGRASQSVDGRGAVAANAIFANGQSSNVVRAQTLWTDSATNNTGGPVTYEFTYLISPAALRVADFAGASNLNTLTPRISFDLEIRANGAVVFSSAAEMVGGFVSHVLNTSGTSLSPAFVGGGSTFGYDFDSAVGTLNLGTFNPGESVTVEYEMVAQVDTPGFELGGLAQVGDPFDLTGTPGFTGTFLANGVVAVEESSWGAIKSTFE